MVDPFVSHFVHVFLCSKRNRVTYIFGTLVNQRTCVSVERYAIGVTLDEVLIDLGTDQFEQKPKMTEDRKISEN